MKFFRKLTITAIVLALIYPVAASAAEEKLRLAGQHPIDHNATLVLKETIAKIESANVGIEIRLFPAGQLGNGEVVFDDVAQGVIDIGHTFIYSHNDPVLEINSRAVSGEYLRGDGKDLLAGVPTSTASMKNV